MTVLNTTEKDKLSELRKEHWMPRGKSCIKQNLYYCVTCRRLNSRLYNYSKSPNLPLSRVDDSYPFICTGIDYTGAFIVEVSIMTMY